MTVAAMIDDLYKPDAAAISEAEIQRIVSDHHRFLTRQQGARAMLQSSKLDGLKLAGRDLSEADLTGASLVGTDLRGANLSRVSLYCADLRGCDLRYARLDHADLRGANFKGANLSHANLDHADLRAATMLHLGDRMRFQGNTHHHSPFGAVDFSFASLRGASFKGAKLDNANFTEALLEGAAFRGARLRNACFRSAVLSGVPLEDLNATSSSLLYSVTAPTPMAVARARPLLAALRAHHDWFTTLGQKGRPARIEGEDLRPLGTALKGLCLAGLSARRVMAVGVDFSGCHLHAAHFDGADIRGATFDEADLSGASLSGAKLSHASFRKAKIRDLRLCTGQVLRFQADGSVQGTFDEADVQIEALIGTMTLGNC